MKLCTWAAKPKISTPILAIEEQIRTTKAMMIHLLRTMNICNKVCAILSSKS